jgi:hypothetical protein
MKKPIVIVLCAFAFGACQQLPESRQAHAGPVMNSSARLMQNAAAGGSAPTRGSRYDAAIVKDLAIGEAKPENLAGFDLANFEAIRPELARLFGASFRETLQREGYVRLALPSESGAEVVTIQAAIMRVAPGHNSGGAEGIAPTELEIAVAILDARGRFLGWYAVQYSGELPSTLPLSRPDVLRRAFADAGEQVARAIADTR